MLDYERELNELFHSDSVAKDKEALSRAYFEFRMGSPERYRLFDRLEERIVKGQQAPEMVEQLHTIRASNFERLTRLIEDRISEGKLEDVPPYFHLLCRFGFSPRRGRVVPFTVLEYCAGRSGRLFPVSDGYRCTHGQQTSS